MKATGIVRRIDDVVRGVLPKEIRKKLHIREGDPLEIFVSKEGEIILKKYSPIMDISDFAKDYCDNLYRSCGHIVVITDEDSVIAISGDKRVYYLGKSLSETIQKYIQNKQEILLKCPDNFVPQVVISEAELMQKVDSIAIAPVIVDDSAVGSVIVFSYSSQEKVDVTELKLAKCVAAILKSQLEY